MLTGSVRGARAASVRTDVLRLFTGIWLALTQGDAQAANTPAQADTPAAASPTATTLSTVPDPLADFESFFRQHHPAMLGYLWRMIGDEQAAHDLSQETFLRAWRHFERVRAYEQPRAWLFRVATHLAWNHLKQRTTSASALAPLPTDPDAEPATAEGDHAARVADSDQVRAVLLGLASRQRSVLVLHDVYGLTSAEVGRALRMSHAAAKMMLCRAREQFRVRYLRQEERP